MSIRILRDAELNGFQRSDRAAGCNVPESQPFHCDLVSRVQPGMTFLELGCGTANQCPQVEARGVHDTGLD